MSHPSNDDLLGRANDLMEYYTGNMEARILQRDLDSNDLEALRHHVFEFSSQRAIEEDGGFITLEPDTNEAMVETRAYYREQNDIF